MKKDLSYKSGRKEGESLKIHPVRYIQEKWNEFIIFGKSTYEEFQAWKKGFQETNKFE